MSAGNFGWSEIFNERLVNKFILVEIFLKKVVSERLIVPHLP